MTLLIDMDDVLEPLLACWASSLNEKYGTAVPYNEISSWDVASFFPCLTRAEVFKPLQDDAFWESMTPNPYSVYVVGRLVEMGHTVRIVTASHYGTVKAKMRWLLKTYPSLKWEDVIIAHDKSLIIGDVIIDDGIHNLETSPCKIKFLYDAPHNRSYDAPKHGMIRVRGWSDIYDLVLKLSGGIQ